MNRIIILIALALLPPPDDRATREPVVAGSFYPDNPAVLSRTVRDALAGAKPNKIPGETIGLVVPHAGYSFSAAVAAAGYRCVSETRPEVVVVIAPSHRDAFAGASIYPGAGYATPLGTLPIDSDLAETLVRDCDAVRFSMLGHRNEHALEVQLPFIQTLFPDCRLLPMVLGRYDWPTCESIGRALAGALGGREVLLVASTDLYHGHSYKACRESDEYTLASIARLAPDQLCSHLQDGRVSACGGGPVVVMQVAAKALGADAATILARTNSGDVTGRKTGYVVGYGSVAVYRSISAKRNYAPLPEQVCTELLRMARSAITCHITDRSLPSFEARYPLMREKRGVFVTLTKNGRLRGCIGHHESDRPLFELVPDMALAAAFGDPRFPPLREDELDEVKIKISVYLTNVYKIDSLDSFVMGVHGIIMRKDGRAATFLPEVPLEAGWTTVDEEMEHLCRKAGLGANAWKQGAEFWVYRTQIFDESLL